MGNACQKCNCTIATVEENKEISTDQLAMKKSMKSQWKLVETWMNNL